MAVMMMNPFMALALLLVAVLVLIVIFVLGLIICMAFLPVILVIVGVFILLGAKFLPMHIRLLVGFGILIIGALWLIMSW